MAEVKAEDILDGVIHEIELISSDPIEQESGELLPGDTLVLQVAGFDDQMRRLVLGCRRQVLLDFAEVVRKSLKKPS